MLSPEYATFFRNVFVECKTPWQCHGFVFSFESDGINKETIGDRAVKLGGAYKYLTS
jgi:hypothetical protein